MKAVMTFLVFYGLAAIGAVPSGIKQGLLAQIKKELPASAQVSIEALSVPKYVPGDASIFILGPHPPLGLVDFELNWSGAEGAKRVFGTAVIRAQAPIAVAKAGLRVGESLDRSNVVFERRELGTYSESGFLLDWSQVLGRRSVGFAHPGTALSASNTRFPAPVVAGQVVNLVDEIGNVRLVARVKALQSGEMAQWIRVQNPTGNKILEARVAAPGEVRLR